MIYLATPYSHPDRGERYIRFKIAERQVLILTQGGHVVYSPIVYWHAMAEQSGLPTTHDFWIHQNEAIMAKSDAIVVVKISGWNTSNGIKHEIDYGYENGIPVYFIEIGDNIVRPYTKRPHQQLAKHIMFSTSID